MKQSEKKPRLKVFQERFTLLCKEHGSNNTDFAEFLEMSRQTVGFYLNGDRVPDALNLIKIAEKCNVSADWLLGLSGTKSTDIDVQKICKKTGLSEHAVTLIIDLVTPLPGMESAPNTLIDSLNDFLGSSSIFLLLWQMSSLRHSNQINSQVLDTLDKIMLLEKEQGELPPELAETLNDKDAPSLFEAEQNERYSRFEVIDTFTKIIDSLYEPRDFSPYHRRFGDHELETRLANYARAHGQYDFADFIEGVGDWSDDK